MITTFMHLDNNVLTNILSYLSPEEAVQFRLLSKNIKARLDNPKVSNMLLWPYINRLRALDCTVSLPQGLGCNVAVQCFKEGFQKINARQIEELKYLIGRNRSSLPPKVLTSLQKMSLNASTLADLEFRDDYLNKINRKIIHEKINLERTILNLSYCITRFSETLFKVEALQDYWAQLKIIRCHDNPLLLNLPESLGNCTSLESLECERNKLQTLPESLGNCTLLTTLSCHCNHLETLPTSLENLVALENLSCGDNKLEAIPGFVKGFHALKSLNVRGNKIEKLPEFIGSFGTLRVLNCSANKISALPESIENCLELEELLFEKNQLVKIPEFIGSFKALRILNCSHNQIKVLPDALGNCSSLTDLDCGNNQLQVFPKTLEHCHDLVMLWCENNQLVELPGFIGNFIELEYLNCSGNRLEVLPESIGNCIALEDFICHNNNIEVIPESIRNCAALQSLDCHANQLRSLPASITNCTMLEHLNCSHNKICQLPESIGNCTDLDYLICVNNQLWTLPESIKHCRLYHVDFQKNQLQFLPHALWDKLGDKQCHTILAKQNTRYSQQITVENSPFYFRHGPRYAENQSVLLGFENTPTFNEAGNAPILFKMVSESLDTSLQKNNGGSVKRNGDENTEVELQRDKKRTKVEFKMFPE